MKPINPSQVLSRSKLKHASCALALGLGFAALFSFAAQAQYYGHGHGPYGPDDFDGPYGGPYGPYGGPYGPYGHPPSYDPYNAGPGGPPPGPVPAYGGPRGPDEYDLPPRQGPRPPSYSGASGPPPSPPRSVGSVSVETIEGRIRTAGYRLIAPPRQKGKIYLAEVEDSKSVRHRLIYDANNGHLIENTPLGPVKKPGGPLPPDENKASGEPGPMDGEPANQARSVPLARPDIPPPPAPNRDEAQPPAASDPAPAPHSELPDRPARMAEEGVVKSDLISFTLPDPTSTSFL